MNFEEAVNLMKEGKKVRRPEYIKGVYFEARELGIVKLCGSELMEGMKYLFADVEATDWEVYRDDSDWNLAKVYGVDGTFIQANVKKCRDLILEDIEKLHNKYCQDLEFNQGLNECRAIINKRFGDLD